MRTAGLEWKGAQLLKTHAWKNEERDDRARVALTCPTVRTRVGGRGGLLCAPLVRSVTDDKKIGDLQGGWLLCRLTEV